MSSPSVPAVPGARVSTRRGSRAAGKRERPPAGSSRTAGYFFVALYVALLLLLGIAPVVYAIYLALSSSGGFGANFGAAFSDYRFVPAFEHVLEFMAFWLVSQAVLVVALVLLLHNLAQRVGSVFRFLFYIPGALAGAASVIVWLFMLDPTASPFAFVLHWLGYAQFDNAIAPGNLPVIYAIMAFWTGAGGWIVVMYGALNNIPHELIEASRIDGANAFQTALKIKLPLIRKWVVYMLVLAFAGGTQLFVEPTVLGSAALGVGVSKFWSPNQLGWFLASQYDQFNEAAAISLVLLVFGLLVAAILVWRGRLFEIE
ncbi:MAG TPA: sugar ABC transporter permease [Solirubrobacteraceae bacterium]|nr:sugar ABC transporter permease [Solirubrobacteraceae bacterium]